MARARQRLLAPEVVQTSAMDCGPAALKCVLEGFGVPVSYGRLREACQTDVDGTSIDVMEEVAQQLGLEAEQTMVPADQLFLAESTPFPAIVVVRNPDGNVHFVVAWRLDRGLVQVMDPAHGRRWMRRSQVLSILHSHAMPVPAEVWREFAGAEAGVSAMTARLRRIGAGVDVNGLLARALADPSWRTLGALDAAERMVSALIRTGALDAGRRATGVLVASFEQGLADLAAPAFEPVIPPRYWSVAPVPSEPGKEEQVTLRGAVVVKVRAREAAAVEERGPLPVELEAALREPPSRPLRDLFGFLREDGLLNPALIVGAVVAASLGAFLEALALRGVLDVARHLAIPEQRVAAYAAITALFVLLLVVEIPIAAGMLRMGRNLELRLRMGFLAKIPKLSDRYFSSRPTSDMTHRAHSIHAVRSLPGVGFRLFRSVADLLVTSAGLVWIDPSGAPVVAAAAVAVVALPWLTQSSLIERDLQVRAYAGSLSRFYFDALLGLFALRTHGGERPLRREHEAMMGEYMRSVFDLVRLSVVVDALEAIAGVIVAGVLLFRYAGPGAEPAAALLLVYWALNLPNIGRDIAMSIRQYPTYRNMMLRILEPLGAIEEQEEPEPAGAPRTLPGVSARAVQLDLRGVAVRAAGQTILEDVSVHIPAGHHIAVVGPSGAGKSSLVGLLLGWHRAAEGEILVDGASLRWDRLARLRAQTAWVDPAVQLWNRSLLENLTYGAPSGASPLGQVLEAAEVIQLLERLPEGLQTALGDSGALVSGGEGQRVRLARAMLRGASRLVILDEPFRGLDRERRRALMRRARTLWKDATLLCVTHDVGETLDFDRVVVIDGGRVVEDDEPATLAAQEGTRFRALLDAEHAVQEGLWSGLAWRRLSLRDGGLEERAGRAL